MDGGGAANRRAYNGPGACSNASLRARSLARWRASSSLFPSHRLAPRRIIERYRLAVHRHFDVGMAALAPALAALKALGRASNASIRTGNGAG